MALQFASVMNLIKLLKSWGEYQHSFKCFVTCTAHLLYFAWADHGFNSSITTILLKLVVLLLLFEVGSYRTVVWVVI